MPELDDRTQHAAAPGKAGRAARSDLRVDLSGQLMPDHALAAVEALDRRRIIVVPGPTPAAALTAAALLVLVARTHAHVGIASDAPLPRNPWGVASLADLLDQLTAARPTPQVPLSDESATTVTVSTGAEPGADRYLAPDAWNVAITDNLDIHLEHLRLLAPTDARSEGDTGSGCADDPGCAGHADEGGHTLLKSPPYGGMFGAAIVAADLFCETLAALGLGTAPRRSTFTWNLLDYTYDLIPPTPADPAPPQWPALLFAGCGSVGSTAAAVLACDDLAGLIATAIDDDEFDPSRNTQRYPAALASTSGPKAPWVTGMLASAGAKVAAHIGPVRSWTVKQPMPGFDGIVISSVDTVDGRYEVADILARTTLSGAVRALAFHIQREHLGDGYRCPFCDFVSTESPLAQAAADAALTGLPEHRIIELTLSPTGLEQHDLDAMVALGKLATESAQGLLGGRVADLRNRLYAQAAIPAQVPGAAPPAPLSAPFVSWAIGVLLASEVAKAARGLAAVNRRVEVDLHGYPANFVHQYVADTSGRCACSRRVRVRWMERLYADDAHSQQREPESLHLSQTSTPTGRAQ